MYVHPIYCLQPTSRDPKGFSVGSDTDTTMFDLPDLRIPQISQQSAVIYNTLTKQGMFPAGSDGDAIAKQGYGCGYELLNKLVQKYLSNYTAAMPAKLLDDRPQQQSGETIHQYFNRYDDYANLQAILENISSNLCHRNELDNFILGLLYSEQYVRITYDEIKSTDPLIQAKYTPGQIVSTLESFDFLINVPPTLSRGGPTLASARTGTQQSLLGKLQKLLQIKSGSPSAKKYPHLKKLVNVISFSFKYHLYP